MGISTNCTSCILFCSEDNGSALGFDDDDGIDEEEANDLIPVEKSSLFGDLPMGIPLQSEDCVMVLVEKELEHLPAEDYAERLMSGALDISVRKDAIDWIIKVHAYYKFEPLCAYLSVNYLDRFLSAYELPQGKDWTTQLLAVACLSLAAKVEETVVPLLPNLQVGEAKYVFEPRTIQRMELLVLSTLKWKMQAVTPFSFIDHFLHKFNEGTSSTKLMISRSVELVLGAIRGIGFLEFRPSEIAASVTLFALVEARIVEIDKAVTSCIYINKERVLRCYEAIHEVALMKNSPLKNASPSASSLPLSPSGVLDAACLSYKSDGMTAGSPDSPHISLPATKKSKLMGP